MTSIRAIKILLAVLACASTAALAHPGHGTAGAPIDWIHFLTSADHLLPALAGLTALFAILRSRRGARK